MIDFAGIAASTPHYNFHSHTQFCDGRATMADFAAAAVKAGMEHYGFSPHSPLEIESKCNMKRDDVEAYLNEFDRLRKLYAGKINFYAGMEIDYISEECGPSHPYFVSLPLDYRIGSVHFIPSSTGPVDVDGSYARFREKMATYFDNDIDSVVKSFYSQTHKMIDQGGFDIIGHFDKIGHNSSHFRPGIEDEAWYVKLINEVIDHIIESGVVVEINTKARSEHHRFFPGERYWPKLKKAGVTLLVNSDTHYPNLIEASRDEAFTLLKNISI